MNYLDQKTSELEALADRAKQSESEIAALKTYVARYQIAYLSLIELHASLMLDSMERNEIAETLDLAYTFNLPADVVADIRAALNAETSNRIKINERTILQFNRKAS